MSVSTPPMQIGLTQVLYTSHCRYQIGVTGLDDTKSNKLSVTINSSVAVTIHFCSLIITFPTFFLKICDLQRKVAITSAGSWFHSLIVLLTEEYLPISVFCFLALILRLIIPAQVAWSFQPVPCTFPCPFCGVRFEQGANASYLPTLRQSFPDRIVSTVCKF